MNRLHLLYEWVIKDIRKVNLCILRMLSVCNVLTNLKKIGSANELVYSSDAKCCHVLTKILCDELHEVNDILWLSCEALSKKRVLCSDSYRAGILVADTHHNAAHCDKRSCSKAVLLCAEHCGYSHVTACHKLTICLDDYLFTKTISDKSLMSLRYTELPRHSSVVD